MVLLNAPRILLLIIKCSMEVKQTKSVGKLSKKFKIPSLPAIMVGPITC